VVTSDPSALFSKLRDHRSRKSCLDKLHSALGLWLGIKLHGKRLIGIRLISISGINNDLFLPIRIANPRLIADFHYQKERNPTHINKPIDNFFPPHCF